MASSNTNIQVSDLDFNSIKSNFITYLQSQDKFKDYNFQGSSLSVLLDVMAYNTQYNAFYLNMVANEMFLDSALQRSSVVSQAKVLDYTPKSAIAPLAYINFNAQGVTNPSFTLPQFTNFSSEAVNGVNYNFITTDSTTVNVTGGVASFNNIQLKQGIGATYTYTVNTTTNPNLLFQIPDANIDTTTLRVTVQQSSSNTSFQIYKPATNYLALVPTSLVYFLQESLNGNYEIYFGDGILGSRLTDGNIVAISYISTSGTSAAGANNFVLMDNIGSFSTSNVVPLQAASQGGSKESIDSIKYQAPKAYAAQNRAVTKEDYITLIQQNSLDIHFDAINVWGGEQNTPPVYGQVFIALKPTGGYSLTDTQKQRLIQNVIKPISVMTVEPTIVDPDYTYVQITTNVLYDFKKTSYTANNISNIVKSTVSNFSINKLNTFNSTFSSSDLINSIQNSENSIIACELNILLQKKLYPNLTTPSTYTLYYNVPIQKGTFLSGITSSPAMHYPYQNSIVDGVYIEEVPQFTYGVDTISIINPGYGYEFPPKINIYGDGVGATAEAVINTNGSITAVNVTNSGNNYTVAYATVNALNSDTQGKLGAVLVNLQGRYGSLRLYYIDGQNGKVIINPNIGTIDYTNGIITLTSFNPYQVDNDLGQFSVTIKPSTTIVPSTYNRIVTVDPFDPNSIIVNVNAKTS